MTDGLTRLAKSLRNASTDVERLLWSRLRAGRCQGVKFRRQQPIGPCIVDFVCLERRLIIELDGGHHAFPDKMSKDKNREAWLTREGKILRPFPQGRKQ